MTPSTALSPANPQVANELFALETIHRGPDQDKQDPAAVLERTHDVLTELHTLLEDYAPAWFPQKQSERTEKVLRELNRLIPSCPGLSAERTL